MCTRARRKRSSAARWRCWCGRRRHAQPFLATCALGFRDPAVPTGLWSAPEPEEICAVSGGYAYIIDTTAPERFTMIPYRPVLEVRPVPAEGLLLFVGHRSILAWGGDGQAWESDKLSDEGISIAAIDGAHFAWPRLGDDVGQRNPHCAGFEDRPADPLNSIAQDNRMNAE